MTGKKSLCFDNHVEHINTLCGQNEQLLGAFTKLGKVTISNSHFCLSADSNSAPSGQIFIKFAI